MQKPKYEFGAMVWLMQNNRPQEERITGIFFGKHKKCQIFNEHGQGMDSFFYAFWYDVVDANWYSEDKIFPTKEALIASL